MKLPRLALSLFLTVASLLAFFVNAPTKALAAGQWALTGQTSFTHTGEPIAALQNGKVIISGGFDSSGPLNMSELYDPATGQWTQTGNVNNPIYTGGYADATLLKDGRVLKVGANFGDQSTIAELYDPATGQWTTTGSLLLTRFITKLVTLQDGRVLMIGGWGSGATGECEIYNPSAGQWTQTGSLHYARLNNDALLLPDGRVLAAGGNDTTGNPVLPSEIYDPATGTWTVDASLNVGHTNTVGMVMLSNGKILIGGTDPQSELYTPSNYTINLPSATINEGDTYSANGSFTDSTPSATSWTATVDYGDGSGSQLLTLSGTNFSLSHIYKDNGTYTVTVSVTDNQGATGTRTATVTVNNVAPTVGAITAPSSPVQVNTSFTASANFTDPGVLDTHTASWNWGDGNTTSGTVTESNGSGSVSDSHTYAATGVYSITLTVTDKDGGAGTSTYQYVAVYDSNTSFAGGRSFDNPSSASPSTSGKVMFGISSKYNNSNILTGDVKMSFKAANLDFASTSLSSLATSNGKAYLKGSGTFNGVSGYTFLASGIDGSVAGGNDLIRFQIKDSSNTVVYDSQPGAGDTADPTATDATGNIRVH